MVQCTMLKRQIQSLEDATERVRRLLADVDSDTANRQPQPGSWSMLQAIEHLNTVAQIYLPRIDQALAEAPPGTGPYAKGTITGRLMLRQLAPEANRRMSAPKIFRPPTTSLTVVRVLDDFEHVHADLIRQMSEADGKDLGVARVRLPLPVPVHMSLAQTFDVHSVHVPRHVGQAERAARAVNAASA